ncbi:hydrogen gas-evolving membrane-bound hydrogenase subunit E [Solirubrobacter deserti]|uniref:Proton-conducting transporter membrane subunit n=1 Tax=Solirubrobacter deserti TaxID=2282478 RepID=A0ABT4RV80_9ACTN|nr:hydrogen gas-evolving membrane-bound hydrogenase subunit E [Solirubrobacter deserti]MDA0142494.1 proton-conducting transporter membrane subunit [Solirubrobacter deserti]
MAIAIGWSAGGGGFGVAWAPTWDLRLAFELDGLAALYGVLAAGIGTLVFLYASAYVPRHLAHQERSRREEARLHGAMVLFLVSMLGLVMAQDLIALFVFWDLTAVASWLLVGYDRHNRDARLSALMALLVTAVSAVLMLVGILMLRAEYGTVQLPELFAVAQESTTVTVAVALIAIAALAKSAQVPFHFWLPRAMAAPTPVSAYLHSAAMVAAGVFLLSRIHPLIQLDARLLDGLIVIGLTSMAVGGLLALGSRGLKRILAYSTISQYGYVVTMLGIGGAAGAAGACFYVLGHALAKSALFMTAGAVTEATGAKALGEVGGLARRMPLLAAGSGAAAAGIAALPLTIGFFKDELFFKAALDRGNVLGALAVLGAALTFAYMARFWTGIFLGAPKGELRPVERRLIWPVALLGALVVVGGLVVGPFADLARDAAVVTQRGAVELEAAYHLDARAENLMAIGAYALGFALFASGRLLGAPLSVFSRLGHDLGPERAYNASIRGLNRLSNRLHDIEVRDLRGRLIAVVVPGAGLVALGVAVTPTDGAYRTGALPAADVPLVVALAVCALAALAVPFCRRHLLIALALSGVGFALATTYSLMGAPDVALVAVLIETIFALLFVGVFALLPRDVLRREARLRAPRSRKLRDAAIATASGVVTSLVVWSAFSRPVPREGMSDRLSALAPEAHGKDIVTVILADFRGLDTLVEITVVAVAMIAVSLLLRGKLRG